VAPSTRLHLRFAAATLAVIATAGGALLWYVQRQEIAQSEQNVSMHARYFVKSILRDELRPGDLTAPVTAARRRQLDWLFNARVLVDGGLRVKLYRASDGVVTYSNVAALIGTKTDDVDELRTVLGGTTVRDVSRLNKEGGPGQDQKALEVYVPVTLRGQAKPAAVFELYQSYAPVASAVRSFVMPFSFLLLGALLAMWTALYPLIQRMVRALERDRSARRSAELALEETSEQLRQAQKMESIGRLAGGVAHDFNNLLLVINGYSEFLSSSLTDERQRRFAAEIRSAGERAAALTQQLLAFSRRQVLQPRVVDLNESIRELHSMLRSMIGEGIQFELSLDDDLHAIEADPGQVGQVLLNLAVNARDAMAGSGTLRISTFNDGDEVVLEVADTGIGMDEPTRSRIFEPFFTTKDVGQGTGLGLSTVYGVVTQSGGAIDVRSAPGRGATFSIRLPATDRVEAAEPVADAAGATAAERILVVDDEQVVRDLLAHTLRVQGYEVEVAAGAHDARALHGPWDLLLTDVVMPEMDGVELAQHVDARHVLFMSGYDQKALVESAGAFLQKPFSGDELARSIRTLLDGSRALATA
jgi:signal transduction histidine kinase